MVRTVCFTWEDKAIVTRRFHTDMAATVTINKWIRDAGASVAKLAEYIAAADGQGLQGEPFRNGVGQMLGIAKKEAAIGPPLSMGRW
jgi:hypothetical protein